MKIKKLCAFFYVQERIFRISPTGYLYLYSFRNDSPSKLVIFGKNGCYHMGTQRMSYLGLFYTKI